MSIIQKFKKLCCYYILYIFLRIERNDTEFKDTIITLYKEQKMKYLIF